MTTPPPSPSPDRHHDLDALRAVAMLLGIVLHAGLSFFPSFWVVADSRPNEAFGLAFAAIHGFRMPVFFVMSGFFSTMLLARRGRRGLVRHRFRRVFLPLLLGLLTIVPATTWISSVAMSSAPRQPPSPEAPASDSASTSLWAAAAAGDLAAIEHHLARGEPINRLDRDLGAAPLHAAALSNHAQAVALLIDRGADVNAIATDGASPLHAAAFVGSDAAVAALLERGARVNAANHRGETPLYLATVDEETTLYFASLLKLPVVADGLGERKAAIADALRAQGAAANSATLSLADLLMEWPLFHHLWFLWFLWWFVLGLAAVSAIVGAWAPTAIRLPAWLVASPLRLVWLVPLTMLPQWFMDAGGGPPMFGADTSSGLLPIPRVLAYYALFFAFGAILYESGGRPSRVGEPWWLLMGIGLLGVFPLGMWLSLAGPEALGIALDPWLWRLLIVGLQAAYPWLLTFGLMGLFHRFCPAESPRWRYLSDSAYWLYLAHLPLVIAAQWAVRDWPLPALVKCLLIVIVVTSFLLATYATLVRYTWLGRFLNGPRVRPEPAVSA